MAKQFIGIKRLWYGEPITAAVSQSSLSTWLASATEVKNSHEDTFTYEQDDPDITDYINELSGKPYYRDRTTSGNKTISFTMGEYNYSDRVNLMGGSMVDADGNDTTDETKAVGWRSSETVEPLVERAVAAMTKTGNFIVFTNASIVAKVDTQEKALGLGVTATAQDSGVSGVSEEYLIDGDGVSI
ncbi:MAG: hypothetical protein LUI09_08390 [Prevotellaceae bacterium]|nr:hypothetical protein [Prevotellaceae bacterium]